MPNPRIAYNVIGARLQKARKKAGFSQVELSATLEVDHKIIIESSIISRMEAGKRPVRDAELQAICKILGVSADWLLGLSD